MLRYVLFDLDLFSTDDDRDGSEKTLLWLLEILAVQNASYLKKHPKTPKLYKSGVKYLLPEQMRQAEVPQVEVIRDAFTHLGIDEPVITGALDDLSQMCGGREHFRDIPRIMDNGGGDCDNLSSWRVAELRHAGINAAPYITCRARPDGGMTYHALVRWPDGTSEDPSLLLGMGGRDREKDRAEERRKNAERAEKAKKAVGMARWLGLAKGRRK